MRIGAKGQGEGVPRKSDARFVVEEQQISARKNSQDFVPTGTFVEEATDASLAFPRYVVG